MRCDLCGKDGLSDQELRVHKKYFHGSPAVGQGAQKMVSGACPDCGTTLFYREGCVSCPSCGYNKCE